MSISGQKRSAPPALSVLLRELAVQLVHRYLVSNQIQPPCEISQLLAEVPGLDHQGGDAVLGELIPDAANDRLGLFERTLLEGSDAPFLVRRWPDRMRASREELDRMKPEGLGELLDQVQGYRLVTSFQTHYGALVGRLAHLAGKPSLRLLAGGPQRA